MEEERSIWRPESGASSPSPAPLGRAMGTLLGSRPRHLEAAISRLAVAGVTPRSTSRGLLDESLSLLWRHLKDAVRRGEPLDEVLVPMIEHSLQFKGPKHSRQVSILLNWLFEDGDLFEALLSCLAAIIMAKKDHYIAFGWCALVSNLVESTLNEFSDKGKHEKNFYLLKTLCQSISSLLSIICDGSILHSEYELPTRLTVAAADCTLLLTEALTEASKLSKLMPSSTSGSQLIELTPTSDNISEKCIGSTNVEMQYLLSDHLDLLIYLVQKLHAWSRKSRLLHSKGLARVLIWMQDIKQCYGYQQGEQGGKLLLDGVLLLHSCWKHYAMLMRLEDHRFSGCYGEMLQHYISAIQLYTNEKDNGAKYSTTETMKFFLNCLSLLMGRLEGKQLEIAITEHGSLLLNILFAQLQHGDDELVEVSVDILRAIIFKENIFPGVSFDTNQMDAVLPILLSFLDERDSTAKAVIPLVAEYCALYQNGEGLQEILKRLKGGDQYQKKNGIDVISALIRICPDTESSCALSSSSRQDIAMHLIECFGDDELMQHILESNLLRHFDPSSVLPALVRVVYLGNEKLSISASDTIVDVLRCHSQNLRAIFTLIDCISGNSDVGDKANEIKKTEDGQKLDVDRVLRLIPKWAESVVNWSLLIDQSISKLFREPSNAAMVRFMSYLSDHLAEARDLVLQRVLLHMQSQHQIEERWLYDCRNSSNNASGNFNDSFFHHLCPLLLLRVLPLRIFDDKHSSILYGGLCDMVAANADDCVDRNDCVAALLFKRAFGMFEFEDVRKLAAELCGRFHPEVLLPVIECQLKLATEGPDIVQMKTCLFALCASLVARGTESVSHPVMSRIQKILEMILSWPSIDASEVSKAQHGCIDCLALMICAELKARDSSKDFDRNRGETASMSSTLTYVIQRLTHDEYWDVSSGSDRDACFSHRSSDGPSYDSSPSVNEVISNGLMSIPFRLCMANVLISACQKVSSSRKDLFACRLLPTIIRSVEAITCSDVRAACLQILFSAVYHLKSSVFPFSPDLLSLSTRALRKGTEKEKVAAAKLMASLMASEDEILCQISGGLLEAKSALIEIASKQSLPELQQLSRSLLLCVSSPRSSVH